MRLNTAPGGRFGESQQLIYFLANVTNGLIPLGGSISLISESSKFTPPLKDNIVLQYPSLLKNYDAESIGKYIKELRGRIRKQKRESPYQQSPLLLKLMKIIKKYRKLAGGGRLSVSNGFSDVSVGSGSSGGGFGGFSFSSGSSGGGFGGVSVGSGSSGGGFGGFSFSSGSSGGGSLGSGLGGGSSGSSGYGGSFGSGTSGISGLNYYHNSLISSTAPVVSLPSSSETEISAKTKFNLPEIETSDAEDISEPEITPKLNGPSVTPSTKTVTENSTKKKSGKFKTMRIDSTAEDASFWLENALKTYDTRWDGIITLDRVKNAYMTLKKWWLEYELGQKPVMFMRGMFLREFFLGEVRPEAPGHALQLSQRFPAGFVSRVYSKKAYQSLCEEVRELAEKAKHLRLEKLDFEKLKREWSHLHSDELFRLVHRLQHRLTGKSKIFWEELKKIYSRYNITYWKVTGVDRCTPTEKQESYDLFKCAGELKKQLSKLKWYADDQGDDLVFTDDGHFTFSSDVALKLHCEVNYRLDECQTGDCAPMFRYFETFKM